MSIARRLNLFFGHIRFGEMMDKPDRPNKNLDVLA
jgi:hypothetical protein